MEKTDPIIPLDMIVFFYNFITMAFSKETSMHLFLYCFFNNFANKYSFRDNCGTYQHAIANFVEN